MMILAILFSPAAKDAPTAAAAAAAAAAGG